MGPEKIVLPPPLPPIPCRHPPDPSPPPLLRDPHPLALFNKKLTPLPFLAPRTPPSPPPSRKNEKDIRNVHRDKSPAGNLPRANCKGTLISEPRFSIPCEMRFFPREEGFSLKKAVFFPFSRGKNRISQGVENLWSLISVPLALREDCGADCAYHLGPYSTVGSFA